MTETAIAELVIAAVAVLGSIGSVLLLAYHIGRLTGDSEARLKAGDDDRSQIWTALGILTGRFDRHVEQAHKR